MIHSSSEDESSNSQKGNQSRALDKSPIQRTWNIDKIVKSTLLQQLDGFPGINSCMFYVGEGFKTFLCHLKVENVPSISSLCSEKPKY